MRGVGERECLVEENDCRHVFQLVNEHEGREERKTEEKLGR